MAAGRVTRQLTSEERQIYLHEQPTPTDSKKDGRQ
jgi:hypothetical protein